MKSIVLGIMISAVSVSFAQTDETPTHVVKDRFTAKKEMKVARMASELDQSDSNYEVQSRTNVKSSVVSGVVRIVNGTPYIDLDGSKAKRRMMPTNLPKAMAKEGQKLQFAYTVSNAPFPKNGNCSMSIQLHDVATPARR